MISNAGGSHKVVSLSAVGVSCFDYTVLLVAIVRIIILVQSNIRRYYVYFLSDQAQILLDHFKALDELRGGISTGFDNR